MKKLILFISMVVLLSSCSEPIGGGDNSPETPIVDGSTSGDVSIDALEIEGYVVGDVAVHDELLIIYYNSSDLDNEYGTKIVIYNRGDNSVLFETGHNVNYFVGAKIVLLDKGFYINQGSKIKVFDYQLEVVLDLDLEEYQQEIWLSRFSNEPFALSQDLSQMTYVNRKTKKLVVYTFDTDQEYEIYDLGDSVGSIFSLSALVFSSSHVGFSGLLLNDGENAGSNVFGRIDLLSKEVEMHDIKDVNVTAVGGYLHFIDMITSDRNYTGTGMTTYYDVENNIINKVDLSSSDNSFDVQLLLDNILISYNDIGNKQAKLIVYSQGKYVSMEDILPNDLVAVGSFYDMKTQSLIVYYETYEGDVMKGHLKEIKLNENNN